MSAELSMLKAFCDDRGMFQKYAPYLTSVPNMDRDIRVLFDLIQKYYEQYSDTEQISKDELRTYYDYVHPIAKNKILHRELIHNLFELNIQPDLIESILEQFMERHYAAMMLPSMQSILEGSNVGGMNDVKQMAEEFVSKMKNPPVEAKALTPINFTVEELVNIEIDPEGLSWPIQPLNDSIGVVRAGRFGICYAYVDTGKTSWGCACTAHWLKQLDEGETLVYAGNEEGAASPQLRITQALCDMDKWEIRSQQALVELMRNDNNWDKLRQFDSIYHVNQVERLLIQHHPKVMVIDQVTKLKTNEKYREGVELITHVANFCRDKAKEYNCHIFGLTQATGDGAHKMWLDLPDIANSRVGIQGELDYAMGIGMNVKNKQDDAKRFFSISKNKFGDHVRFPVIFDPKRNKWTAI